MATRRAADVDTVEPLQVDLDNEPAGLLYERAGFTDHHTSHSLAAP